MIDFLQKFPLNVLQPALLRVKKENEAYFYVGGFVRDLILKNEIYDIDLAVIGPVMKIAKRLADDLNAPYFILNDLFEAARIMWLPETGIKINIDLVGIRGDSIEQDLMLRDFSINALAVNIDHLEKIIDPCGGLQDIKRGIVRICHEKAFHRDPIRTIRAVRQSVNYGLSIEKNTINCLRKAVPDLVTVSVERIRDELFKIFTISNRHRAILLLNHFKIFHIVFPEVFYFPENEPPLEFELKAVWEHSFQVVNLLSGLLKYTIGNYEEGGARDIYTGEVVIKLGRYRYELEQYFSESIAGDRNNIALLFFAALFHDCGKISLFNIHGPEIKTFINHDYIGGDNIATLARKMALSNQEIDTLKRIVSNHMSLHLAVKNQDEIDHRWIFRFIKNNQRVGIMILFLSLADTLSQIQSPGFEIRFFKEINICRMVLDAYFGNNSILRDPPQFVDGYEIMNLTGLPPGPKLGQIKEIVQEETAIGMITSKAEAVNLIKRIVKNNKSGA